RRHGGRAKESLSFASNIRENDGSMKNQSAVSRCRVWSVLLLLVGSACSVFAELPFTQFTPEGGLVRLPSASVQKVLQDRAGYIWLGFFSSGLSRYDGHAM